MRAKDIMTTQVLTVAPEATVREAALLLADKGITSAPVVDRGEVVGIVSEGDLLHLRDEETEGPKRRSSWYRLIDDQKAAAVFDAKSHSMHVRDVMTREIIAVSELASLAEVADTLVGNNVKQLMVMREKKLLGIVSRTDIVRTLAAKPEGALEPASSDDDELRIKVVETLENIPGTSPWLTTVIVSNGVVDLYGTVEDAAAREPSCIAIKNTPFVVDVRDHRSVLQPY
jgi:CBS domain-containing protein